MPLLQLDTSRSALILYPSTGGRFILCTSLLSVSATHQQVFAAELLPGQGGYTTRPSGNRTGDGSYNGTTGQHEFGYHTGTFTATATLSIGTIFWANELTIGGIKSSPGVSVSSVNISTGEIATSAAHNLTTADRIMVSGELGAVAPGGVTLDQFYYAEITSATTLKLRTTPGSTVIASFSSTPTGTLYIRNCNASLIHLCTSASPPLTFTAGAQQSLKFNLSVKNS